MSIDDHNPIKRKSPRQAGVPHRFGVGTLLLITALFAVLFSLMSSLGASAGAIAYLGIFFAIVGVGQSLLFKGTNPRAASMLIGACLLPWLGVVVMILDTWQSCRIHSDDTLAFGLLIAFGTVFGCWCGYLIGVTIGGAFLVSDFVKSSLGMRVYVAEEEPAQLHFPAESYVNSGCLFAMTLAFVCFMGILALTLLQEWPAFQQLPPAILYTLHWSIRTCTLLGAQVIALLVARRVLSVHGYSLDISANQVGNEPGRELGEGTDD